MARKSRKHLSPEQQTVIPPKPIPQTVGYVRLSTKKDDYDNSITNQKFIIEVWGDQNQIPISRYYIDHGFSGRDFDRPAFNEMIENVNAGKISCIVVKDLSRLGRDFLEAGYYVESFFPSKNIRLVSVNDHFDSSDIENQYYGINGLQIRIPLTNLLNEITALDIKRKTEMSIDVKAREGEYIGVRPPFGYTITTNAGKRTLLVNPDAAKIVKEIFSMAASGVGLTAIVRHLNEQEIATPIQYSKTHIIQSDGSDCWNSRSVKYILTNRTYTGMLVQGKEKRVVTGTHEALISTETFDEIQKVFVAQTYRISTNISSDNDNILKGKVICGCCGGIMQRKRGSNHADWHFFTCITKNRLGADRCIGMYGREEDVFAAIYCQLNLYLGEWFISPAKYQEALKRFDERIDHVTLQVDQLYRFRQQSYERFIDGEISKEDFATTKEPYEKAKAEMERVIEEKQQHAKNYKKILLMAKVNHKDAPLSDIIDCIEKIEINQGKKIKVTWHTPFLG